jgi:OPA family sugar phosphate sensor protein UhpC-like MFS transporter
MATPLTAEHRLWRRRVFIATWLSYVGFYFCRKPFSAAKGAIGEQNGWDTATLGNIWAAYLIAYAIGQFLASWMGTKLGPRLNVQIGMAVAVGATVAMGFTDNAAVMAVLVFINGLAQATGFSGNVGTMANWFHKHERGFVMGAWSTNFNVGSLVSGWMLAWVLGLASPAPWRWCFYAGAAVLTLIWILFYFLQRTRPEDVGLMPVDDPETPVDEARTPEPPQQGFMGLSSSAWKNLFLVAGFYFFVKFIRYALWSWAPYFIQETFHKQASTANWYATSFDILGLPSVIVTGWISDRIFKSRRSEVAMLMLIGATIVMALMFVFATVDVLIFVVLLALVGFLVYGPDSVLTAAGAIDIGGRNRATFAAAVISGFGSMGAVVQELLISRIYDPKTGSLSTVFGLLLGSAAIATAFAAALVMRNRRGGRGI